MGRVLADELAREKVVHLRAVINGGFLETVQQVIADGEALSDPNLWEGPRAAEFRALWPELRRSLLDTHAHLGELAGSIDAICSQILAAGGV